MNNETPTKQQLKQALAKMLPEKITHTLKADPNNLYYFPAKNADVYHMWVLDTELLHLCWLVEETLNPAADKEMESDTPNIWRDYVINLDALCCESGGQSCVHATWQQRTVALSKVLGVEIE